MNNQADTRSPRLSASERLQRQGDSVVLAELNALGFTTREILRRLGALTDANKTLLATKDGEFTDEMEVPDNPIRLAAIEAMLKLTSAFPSAKLEVSGTLRVESLQALAVRLEALPAARLDEIIEAEDVEPLLLEAPRGEEREANLP